MLPIKCLQEPPKELLVRECNLKMVESLKQEILDNPCNDVTPILCIVNLQQNGAFDHSLKEAYLYSTIGGNHSRQAFQEILKENPEFNSNRQYTHRLCAVYSPMANTLARRLASKHNRAATYSHEMTCWDWVSNYSTQINYKFTLII